jgi:hypothetical protein
MKKRRWSKKAGTGLEVFEADENEFTGKIKDDADIYDEEEVERELEEDEISSAEAGFMEGYDRDVSAASDALDMEKSQKKRRLAKS